MKRLEQHAHDSPRSQGDAPANVNNATAVRRVVMTKACSMLKPAARLLVIVLAEKAHWETGYGFTGQRKLSEATGLSVKTIQRMKEKIEAIPAEDLPFTLTWHRRTRENGTRTSDAYTILPKRHSVALASSLSVILSTQSDTMPSQGDKVTQLINSVDTTGVPTENKNENSNFDSSEWPQATADKPEPGRVGVPEGWLPNNAHHNSARAKGIDVKVSFGKFVVEHIKRRTPTEGTDWDLKFGGWLKGGWARRSKRPLLEAPEVTAKRLAEEEEAASVAKWRADVAAGRAA